MASNPEKTRAKARRYRERKKIEKYGLIAAGVDMRGRHGNQARGSRNGRWNSGRMLSSHGYVLVRVGHSHPLAFGNGYVYEHHLAWCAAGNAVPGLGEVVHHKNDDKTDNRLENLELVSSSEHMAHHALQRERDELGRFKPEDLRVRELPSPSS